MKKSSSSDALCIGLKELVARFGTNIARSDYHEEVYVVGGVTANPLDAKSMEMISSSRADLGWRIVDNRLPLSGCVVFVNIT